MADDALTLEQAKSQLKLEADEHDQDAHVLRLIGDAQAVIETYLNRTIVETWPEPTARQRVIANRAILLTVEEWFVGGAGEALSGGVVRLLNLIRIPRI